MTQQFLTREKFKTELGRTMYDELVKINNNEELLYVIFYHCKGDDNKKKFLDWLHQKDRSIFDINIANRL